MFFLLLILSSVTVGAISLSRAIHVTRENLFRNLPSLVTIDMDFMRFTEDMMEWQANDDWNWSSNWLATADRNDPSTFPSTLPSLPAVTPSDVRAIGASEYVRDFDYSILTHLHSFELGRYAERQGMMWQEEGSAQMFDVRGTSRTELVQIEQGSLDLVQGHQFSESDLTAGQESSVAMVSVPFAQANSLTLGSTFSLYHFVMYPDEYGSTWGHGRSEAEIYASVGMEFEVVGLFDLPADANSESNAWGMNAELAHLDVVYVPNWAIEDISYRTNIARRTVWDAVDIEMPFAIWWDLGGPQYQDEAMLATLVEATMTHLFVLEHPTDIQAFIETTEDLLPDYHFFVDLAYSISPIVASMEFMGEVADWILYGSVGATLVVVGLLITLFLRDRRHEIGTYLALGEKKIKIVSQILLETLLIAITSITLALFVGSFLSGEISQAILENEVVARFEENQLRYEESPWLAPSQAFDRIGISSRPMTPEEMIEAFDVSFDMEMVAVFYAVGLGAVIISTAIPALVVTKTSPKKVLM